MPQICYFYGITIHIQFSNLLKNPPSGFSALRDQKEFQKVPLNPFGGIQWDCGADLSADYLVSA